MKQLIFASAMGGLLALTGPAFSQSDATPTPDARQAAPAQPAPAGGCSCCKQMAMMQQDGMMGMQQRPAAPAPAQPN